MAQAPVCSEQTIRDSIQNNSMIVADDEYFWSARYDKPLIGKVEHEEALKKVNVENPRTNQVTLFHPQQIVVSKSGDMAYEYGTGDLSYDDQKAAKRLSGTIGYFRVWKSVDGQCKVAATTMRPLGSTPKAN
jgi:hypothetical protein